MRMWVFSTWMLAALSKQAKTGGGGAMGLNIPAEHQVELPAACNNAYLGTLRLRPTFGYFESQHWQAQSSFRTCFHKVVYGRVYRETRNHRFRGLPVEHVYTHLQSRVCVCICICMYVYIYIFFKCMYVNELNEYT